MIPITNLRNIQLFAGLPEDALFRIQEHCRERHFERGQALFREDQLAEGLFVLEKGTIAIRMKQLDGEHTLMVTALRDPGSIIGWSAIIGNSHYTASAVCMDEVTVIAVDGAGLRELIHEDCETGVVILEALANVIASRLQATRVQMMGASMSR